MPKWPFFMNVVICHTPYDFSGQQIDYFQRWRKLVEDPIYYQFVFQKCSQEPINRGHKLLAVNFIQELSLQLYIGGRVINQFPPSLKIINLWSTKIIGSMANDHIAKKGHFGILHTAILKPHTHIFFIFEQFYNLFLPFLCYQKFLK